MRLIFIFCLLICGPARAAVIDEQTPLVNLPPGTVFKYHQAVDLYFCKQFATQIFNGEMSCKNFKARSHVVFDGPRGLFEGSQTQIKSGQICTLKSTPSYGYKFYFQEPNCPELSFEMNWEGIKNYTIRVEDLKKIFGDMVSIEPPEV